MRCLKCATDNPDGKKFCRECGAKLALPCPYCDAEVLPDDKFCGECGHNLILESSAAPEAKPIASKPERGKATTESERKLATVLFSDMSGFTAMNEKLDPEEVKELMARIFGGVSQVVAKYEGMVDKFIGDAVMALFGVPQAHEDDPIRAIRAAQEIHDLVAAISPEVETGIGQPLVMHSGVNTGLVVTGTLEVEKGLLGFTGDTINLAARLSSKASEGEILVGRETHALTRSYFKFEQGEHTQIKGKAEPVRFYKVLEAVGEPGVHRLAGFRAALVGRKVEMGQLMNATNELRQGSGSILTVCGGVGTGKSRLVEELKASLNLDEFRWLEGHAYAYCQKIPYFPLIDLLNKALQIDEGDPPSRVRQKIESGLEPLVGKRGNVTPYIGSLYSLTYPETEDVSPEFWKARLHDAVRDVLTQLAEQGPTIVFLEDIHWADQSTVELIHYLLADFRSPILFVLTYRPVFTLVSSHQVSSLSWPHQEIRLLDLSMSETQDMVTAMLGVENVPPELSRFVQDKVEGNPFYLEEVINSLIESETLIRDNGGWILTKPVNEAGVPTTIHGVILARLDRLERETKRILQEASVIGRAFYYEIITRITAVKEDVERSLLGLERLDFIRTRTVQPDIEYMFKHALTQEVVYNGLLKKERQVIHQRIGTVMEQLFQDRLSEFYEPLAFHFKQGQSMLKAVNYLMKSGEKSLRRYAVEESHGFYREAFELLSSELEMSKNEHALLIDLLHQWAFVYYYRGDFKGLAELLSEHLTVAETLEDKAKLAMFYTWYGFALYFRLELKDSHEYLCRGLELAEEINDQKTVGLACAWLSWTCCPLGLLEEGLAYGRKAGEIYQAFPADQYLFFKFMGGLGMINWWQGNAARMVEIGNTILEFGHKHSNVRCITMGNYIKGCGYVADGDYPTAVEYLKKAVEGAADPCYAQFSRLILAMAYLFNEQYIEAEEAAEQVSSYSRQYGGEYIGLPADAMRGIALVAGGQMSRGLNMVQEFSKLSREKGAKGYNVMSEFMLGRIFTDIVLGESGVSPMTMAKNIGFIIRNVPTAPKKAEAHLTRAIDGAENIGYTSYVAHAKLLLGLVHKAKGRNEKAMECLSEASQIFEAGQAQTLFEKVREQLNSLS
ncbi:AAA family ATPase [Thermodesulfobacteriota bacterium]